MDNNQKVDDRLNLAVDLTSAERQYTTNLNVGYNEEANTWELIVKYNGNIGDIPAIIALTEDIEQLTMDYAIVTIKQENIDQFASFPEIEYVEKPSSLYFNLDTSLRDACITSVQNVFPLLKGNGVLLGIIDSGIDYSHPDFRNEDGTTRIVTLWDQSIQGSPPEGFSAGTEYTAEQINEALSKNNRFEMLEVVPSDDFLGHGTHVAGIAGGNGRASNGQFIGVAPEAEYIIVKLGRRGQESFPSTTEIMRALVYVTRKAEELGKPISINLSFGNNYGPHDGKSLFETFIDSIASEWKNVISVGSGNEGSTALHTSGTLDEGDEEIVEIAVFTGEPNITIQLWKAYSDAINVSIQAPNGVSSGFISPTLGKQQFNLDGTRVLLYYGEPSPFNLDQQIYIELIPQIGDYVTEGIWKITLQADTIVSGNYDMWLPGSVGKDTKFLRPTIDTTLTMPSTATKVITVGAYDSSTGSLAPFSGRGYTRRSNTITVKPDLVAPGVNIVAAYPGGGYDSLSGTSMATPFVTGSAALLMEWGIVKGNDPYLYGEKVKSYLQRSARRNEELFDYPNNLWGYGTLCLANAFRGLGGIEIAENKDTIEEIRKRIREGSDPEICKQAVISEEYFDLLIEYESIEDIYERYNPECIQILDDQYAVVHIFIGDNDGCRRIIDRVNLSDIPHCFGPYAISALEDAGILTFHNQPYVPLRGGGVIIGIIDSGVDYTDSIFKYEDNTTKIKAIWDQTIQGSPPEGFIYGTEFTEEQINEALQAEDPLTIVPSVDETGHGTFLAGMSAGREDRANNFVGAAPDASIVVVKLKEAKRCLKDFYLIGDNLNSVYQNTDVIFAAKYIRELSVKLQMPLSMIIGVGSNQGAHDGSSITESYLQSIARRIGNTVTVAVGNESNLAHHYRGQFEEDDEFKNVEIKVPPNEPGFTFNIWSNAPDKISISITSPTGEFIDRIPATLAKKEEIKFLLERTTIYIEYQLSEGRTGDEVIFVRMEDPTEGIWTITVYGDLIVNGRIDVWLPRKDWVREETQFLLPDPFTTITDPSSSIGLLSVGAYNHRSGSLYLSSGRGLTRDDVLKPDLVAPGVGVVGPMPDDTYGPMTGTSISAAITGGAAALLLEWGIIKGNDPTMDTGKVRNYLIRGAKRKRSIKYPNSEWGYGELDLLGAFQAIRGSK
ncbi:S8 family peptidase [Vallitalea guaymasensis]|uniref:S8 family peptidase n=1 Tax=Vallitalea guaymasensis TaxID=1185412 RepID=UPI002ED27FE4